MYIKSLKKFLTISIILALVSLNIINILWAYYSINKTNAKFFDALLLESAEKLNIFLTGDLSANHLKIIQQEINNCDSTHMNCNFKSSNYKFLDPENKQARATQEQFEAESIFQVWSINPERLLLHSANIKYNTAFIVFNNKDKIGFHDINYNNQKWRVYTYVNKKNNLIIQTAQLYEMRETLGRMVLKQRLIPLLFFIPIIILLIIIAINIAINSLNSISRAIKRRDPKSLALLYTNKVPKEILPLTLELNRLFKLINNAFENEQRFNSDAAHELKTPLATVKTQAEVALRSLSTTLSMTNNIESIKANLHNIITAVNNSSHMVSQLLILSRLSPNRQLTDLEYCHIDKISREIIADLLNHALQKNITIELNIINELTNANVPTITGNKTLIAILIRNVIDNAIKYSGNDSEINVNIIANKIKNKLIFEVADHGPGLPDKLKQRIFDRFYRQPGTNVEGSGLGLSIVKLIAELHRAKITVQDNHYAKHGLSIQVIFSVDQNQ
jgi:two-component system sensor histidine kinase QseC